MQVGDTFEIKNRKYKVIEILRKRHYEQDILLCKTKHYKECFQRFDIEGGQVRSVDREVRINGKF